MKRYGMALAVAATIIAGQALARDRFVGDWTKNCDPGFQCWAEITRKGKSGRYSFSYFAATLASNTEVVCRKTVALKRSGNTLVGLSRQDRIQISPASEGGILVVGVGNCRERPIDGEYGALGDI